MTDGRHCWHDPEHYESLCAPFPDQDAANAAVEAFADEVRALRDKYRLRDVVVCVEVTIAHDGRYVSAGGMQQMGDSARAISMLKRGLNQMRKLVDGTVPRWTPTDEETGEDSAP